MAVTVQELEHYNFFSRFDHEFYCVPDGCYNGDGVEERPREGPVDGLASFNAVPTLLLTFF